MPSAGNRLSVKALLILAGCSLLLLGSAARAVETEADATPTRPLVLTTIRPLTLIAGDVAGDWADIRQLLPDGALPHHFSLKMSHRNLIDQADLVIWIGPALESFLVKAIAGRGPGAVITGIAREPLVGSSEPLADEGREPGNNRATLITDPHIWLDPEWGVAIAEEIASWLIQRYPDREASLLASLAALTTEIRIETSALMDEFKQYEGKVFISDHDAFSHFAARFHLESAGSLHDDSGLLRGARGVYSLRQQRGVACVLAEPRYDARRVEELARDLGVRVVTIDPLGSGIARTQGGYSALIGAVAQGFRACFAGESG